MATENVEVVYSADVAGYTRSLGEAIAVTEQYSKATGGLSGQLNNLATVMSTKMLTAAKGFSGANQTLAGQAAAYQQALAPLEATTVTTGESFKKLAEDTRRLGREFPIGVNNAVQSVRQLQQLGSAQGQIKGLAEGMINLAGATGSSIPGITLEMTQLSRTFGNFNPKAVAGMADSLVATTNKFGGAAQSVLQFSNAIAPLSKQAGMGQASVMGFATAFSRLGEDGYRSANAFNKMLIDMDRSVREGSDTMRVYANTVDMTVNEFQKLFQLDPGEAVTKVFEGLNRQGPDAIRTLEMMGLEGTRTLSSITNLVQSGELGAVRDEAMASYGSGASGEAAEAAFGGLNDQLTKLNETLSQVGAQAGRPFLSFMEKATQGATGLAGAFEGLLNNGAVQALIGITGLVGGVGALGAKAGGAALGFGGILQLLGMGAKDGRPNALVRGLGSPAGKVGMLGAAGAFGAAQMLGGESDVPWGLLSLGALGAYGRYGRGKGAGRAAGAFRGITDMFVLGPALAASNPMGTLRGETKFSTASEAQERRLRDLRNEREIRSGKGPYGPGEYGAPMGRREYFGRFIDIAGDMDEAARRDATGMKRLGRAGRMMAGNAGRSVLAGGMTLASSGLGMVGGPLGLAAIGGITAYSSYAANKAAGQQIRETAASDPLSVLNEFRNATGRAGEAMASLAATTASATASIAEMTEANQTYSDALNMTESEQRKLADWEARSPEFVTEGNAERVAAQMTAMTLGNPGDMALAMQDLAKRRGTAFTEEVAALLEASGGGTATLRPAAFETLRQSGAGEFGGFMGALVQPWFGESQTAPGASRRFGFGISDIIAGPKQGAELGALVGQGLAEEQNREREMGGLPAQMKTQDQQVREMIDVVASMAESQTLTNKGVEAAITALTTAGVDEEVARTVVGRAGSRGMRAGGTERALEAWEQSAAGTVAAEMANQTVQVGTEAERRIRADVGVGAQDVTGYFSGSSMVTQERGSTMAENLYGVMDKLRDANVDLTEALEANKNGIIDLTETEVAIVQALNNPESPAAMFNTATSQVELATSQGMTLQQQEAELNRLIDVGEYAEGDPQLMRMQAQRGRVQQLRQYEQARMGRGERWAQAREDFATWETRRQEMEASGQQMSGYQFQEYQATEQRAMQAEEEERQYMLQRVTAQENLNHQLARSAETFGRQQGYQRQDFLRGMERQEHDYYLGVQRMTEDFQISQARSQEDYQINRARSEEDYYRNRGRTVADFNRSLEREAADHQRAVSRLAVDTAKSMADPYQRIFGQATYSPQGLAQNMREQQRMFKEQMDTLDQLRKRGMSQQAIDVLGLAEAGNAQQAITLGEASRADIRRLNRQASQRVQLGGEFRDESLTFRRSEQDRSISLRRQRADMRRNLRRGDADFRRSLERGDADFAKSLARQNADYQRALARSATDYQTSIARANEDFLIGSERAFTEFSIQMAQAQEDLDRSFRDINGDMKEVTKAYRRFVRGENNLLEGLITDTDTKVAESAKANTDLLEPPNRKEYKDKWKAFAEDIKDGLSEAGFDLGGGIKIFLSTTGGGGGGGAPAPPGTGAGWGGAVSGGASVSSPYGMRTHPVTGQRKLHTGTDYNVVSPDNDVYSPFFGQVLNTGWFTGYGPGLVLKSMHDPVALFYGHLNTGDMPREGEVVAPGEKVGSTYPGAIGYSTGQHLHLEVLKDPYRPYTDAISPQGWLKHGGIAMREHDVKVGEYGPEAVIPLNERGLDFMARVARHVDGVAVGASQAASYSNTTVYNNQQYSYDQSTRFTGPVNVTSNDPVDMANKAAARARRERALAGRGG